MKTKIEKDNMLRRGFKLWYKTTGICVKVGPLILAGIFFAIVVLLLEPQYVYRINDLPIQNKHTVYVWISIVMLFVFFIKLVNVFDETIKNDYQIKYWLTISKWEFYVYIYLKRIYWYYFFVILMFLLGGELWRNKIFYLFFLTVLYILGTCFIYTVRLAGVYHGNKRIQSVKKKNAPCGHYQLFRTHPNIELILTSWLYRYTSVERLLCKVGTIGVGIFFLNQSLSEKKCFVVYFILFFVLSFVDDNYWKKEILNADLLRTVGVSFGKYFFVNTMSGMLFYSIGMSLLCGLASQNILCGIFFSLVTSCFLCYWNSVYLYIYLLLGRKIEWLKQVLLLLALIIEFIPVINIIMGGYFARKAFIIWRKTLC